MRTFRIALANIPFPSIPEESVALAEYAIAQTSSEHAGIALGAALVSRDLDFVAVDGLSVVALT